MSIRELQKAVEETIFVGQAHKMGIFNALHERPDTSDGLSARMGFDPRCTWVLLEALVEMGYCRCLDHVYSITDDAYRRLVDRGGELYEGGYWDFILYLINPWRTLPHVLKRGEPDLASYEGLSMEEFIGSMDSPWKKKVAPEIVDLCLRYCGKARVVADIGGAPGTMAREFARRGLKTIVYDLPVSLAVTADILSAEQGIEVIEGDATKSLPDRTWDIAFLGNICHGQSPEDNASMIAMSYERISNDGIIVIFDNLRGEAYRGATLALHMITQSPRGNIYRREEYFAWLEGAGFAEPAVEHLSDPAWQLVIARKK